MSNQLSLKSTTAKRIKMKWFGIILMAVGSYSFINNTIVGDVIALSGAILFLGVCINSRFES